MRAAIYLRVSTADQHPENQLRELATYAERVGWEVVATETDKESGTKGTAERVGLARVMDLARRRGADVLLFWSLDRLSREGTRKTLEYLTALDGYGVKWHSYTEQYLSSMGPFADVVVSLLATLAKQESLRRSERVLAGMARARAEGKHLGRPAGRGRKTATKAAHAARLRAEGKSYAEVGAILGVTRQRAQQLCTLQG